MEFKLCGVGSGQPSFFSRPGIKHLSAIMILFGLLSGCGTKVDSERAGNQLIPAGQQPPPSMYPPPPTTPPPGTTPTLPIDPTQQPGSPQYPQYPIYQGLNCWIERPGAYYYVGQGVQWQFKSSTGVPLQVVWIDSGEQWSQQPQYPLPDRFSIYFYTPGWRRLAFQVKAANGQQYCNNGQPLTDEVFVNGYDYYPYAY